jgi:hypothetical protein
MLNPQSLDSVMTPRLAPERNATRASEEASVWQGLDHLIRHSRIEPIIRRIFPDQRRYERVIVPHIVAYLGNAHASRPRQIANISVGGFCMLGDEHWTPGTEMPITLQREEWDGEESSERVSVQAIVMRRGRGEVGFSIALTPKDSVAFSDLPAGHSWISTRAMEQFIENLKKPRPPRLFLVNQPVERPLSMAERTERLLEIARLHSLSQGSELWHVQNRP